MTYLQRSELQRRREEARRQVRRRRLVGGACGLAAVLAAVVVGVLVAGPSNSSHPSHIARIAGATPVVRVALHPRQHLAPLRVDPAHPGVAHVYDSGPRRREVALTFDDGFCGSCVARIVRFLARTGGHATIFPNGRYSAEWDPVAGTIRMLVARGQLTVGNHTYLHHDALEESASAFQLDVGNNETWIEHEFGISARPFFRPPYGAYNSAALTVLGQLGYTKVIMWSGTVADSSVRTIPYILGAIKYWAKPGAIILLHGNYPATSLALPQIYALLHQRGLRPVTLAQLLG